MPLLRVAAVALAAIGPQHLAAARTSTQPALDGRLDDDAWKTAPASDAFTQKSPLDGTPPVDRTVVRILYDADNVYVGIDCPQSVPVVARLTRRDRQVEADSVTVVLDTRSDGKTAFEFGINAAGVLEDALHFNDTDLNQDWDENWEGAVAVTARGWSAELRIPLRALRFPARAVQSWGLQVRRYVSARQETDEWAHIRKDAAGEVSHYGRLDDLEGLASNAPIEIRPFIVGTILHHDPSGSTGTVARGFQPQLSAGLDLKWHVSQSLTLDATLFPDFGQVEADQVIFNLTNYEIYLPEKRPFFLEGVDTFASPIQLLYTRRIGKAPEVPALFTLPPAAVENVVNAPQPSTIYGAAKLTGDLGGHWTFGELYAVTGRQTIQVQPDVGRTFDSVVDPYTVFKVLRLKRDIGDNAHVGVMLTSTNRLESGHDYPVLAGSTMGLRPAEPGSAPYPGPSTMGGAPLQLCPTGDTLAPGSRCFHDAYVASVDGRWRSPSGDYSVTGQAIGTLIENGPPRTMLDGTVIKSGDSGPGVNLHAAKDGGGSYIGAVDFEAYGRRTDYNDLGFMLRQNSVKEHANLEYRILDPRGATLETHTWIDFVEQDNLDGENQSRILSVNNWTRFKNFWSAYCEIDVRPRHFDDREVGDGAALERGALLGAEVAINSDKRERVYAEMWTQVHAVENGVGLQGNGLVSLKVLPQWDVDLLPTWVYARGEPRYFGSEGSNYLFGRQRAQSLSLTLRSTYTFTTRFTLQAYMQAILEAAHYSDYSFFPALGKGTRVHLSDLRPVGPAGIVVGQNPDYENGVINANLVARWEYLLGSTIFLVYTHSQNTTTTPSFGDPASFDFAHITPRAAQDALLLKISYWLG